MEITKMAKAAKPKKEITMEEALWKSADKLRGSVEPAEYGVSKASISIWTKQFREECQTSEEAKADYDYMKENLQLKRQLAELQKENEFLKKAAAFFAKEID
jgi:transposase